MELLCIETHPSGLIVAGISYPFISDKCPCNCDAIDVGVIATRYLSGRLRQIGSYMQCASCKVIYIDDGILWAFRKRFAQIATEDEVKKSEQSKQEVST